MSEANLYTDDPGLRGKAAIVTGGGAEGEGLGNGRAAAILLARAGVRVLVADLNRELAENTVRMIEEAGGEGVAHGADVTDEEQCREMVAAAVKHFGRLDFLDNNVGIGGRGSVVEMAPDEWRRIMQVNVETMYLAARHAIPAIIESGDGGDGASVGDIVNVASISA